MTNPTFYAIYDKFGFPFRFFLTKQACRQAYNDDYTDDGRKEVRHGEYKVPVEDED